VFVRKYLEKKAAEKALEKAQAAREEVVGELPGYTPALNEARVEPMEFVNSAPNNVSSIEQFGTIPMNGKTSKKSKKSSGGLLSKISSKKDKDDDISFDFDSQVDNVEARPAFSTQHNSSRKKGLRPREVAVPYSKLRKDRFFDWPPDPTVSRATPIEGPWTKQIVEEVDTGVNAPTSTFDSGPSPQPIPGASPGLNDEGDRLRRRYVTEQQQFAFGNGLPPQNIPEGISPW
jgi:hypothetical protein